jgi:O-antigen/teichoic acid export membrane protein
MSKPGIRQALVVFLDQGFCSATNFLTGALLARACSKAEYGLYVLGFTLLVITMDIQVSLSGIPFTVLSPQLKSKDRRFYLGSTLIQHLGLSVVVAAGFVMAAFIVSITAGMNGFANMLFALSIASVLILLRDFIRFVLLSELRVWTSLLMGLTASVTTIGLLFWAYSGDNLTVSSGYLIMGVGSGVSVVPILLKEKKQISFTTKRLREHLGDNWRFGKWLVAQAVADFAVVRLYPWALMLFIDSSATAVYGVCVIFAGTLNPLLMGINRYLGPRAAQVACHRRTQIHHEIYYWMVLIVVPLLAFLLLAFFFGEWAIVTIYGNKFAGIGHVFTIYLISYMILIEGIIIAAGTNALRRPDISFWAQIIGFAVTVSLGLFLVYRFGPLGAVIGVCLSRAVTVIWHFAQFQCLGKIPLVGIQPMS